MYSNFCQFFQPLCKADPQPLELVFNFDIETKHVCVFQAQSLCYLHEILASVDGGTCTVYAHCKILPCLLLVGAGCIFPTSRRELPGQLPHCERLQPACPSAQTVCILLWTNECPGLYSDGQDRQLAEWPVSGGSATCTVHVHFFRDGPCSFRVLFGMWG